MARPSIITDPRRKEIEADLRGGMSQRGVAEKYSVSVPAVTAFAKWYRTDRVKQESRPSEVSEESPPGFPPLPKGASPLDEARASAAYAKAMLEWMQRRGASPKELTSQQSLYLQAQKYVSNLLGVLNVTPSQVARHPLVVQLFSLVEELLEGDLEKVGKLRAGLEKLVGVKREP